MRYLICQALEKAGVDEDLLRAIATDDVPGAWGHRVIECDDVPLQQFLEGGGTVRSGSFINRFGDIPFAEACGSMGSFVTDPSWHDLHRRLRQRVIEPTDEEWAFS